MCHEPKTLVLLISLEALEGHFTTDPSATNFQILAMLFLSLKVVVILKWNHVLQSSLRSMYLHINVNQIFFFFGVRITFEWGPLGSTFCHLTSICSTV
jgi:hypothetical protein